MSPSIVSFPSVLLISAIAAVSSPSLIQFACSDNQVCVRLLESMPEIAAAKDLLSLSLAIAGISNSTNTQAYVKKALNHSKSASWHTIRWWSGSIDVRDAIISRGNRVVPILGLSAFTVVADRSESPLIKLCLMEFVCVLILHDYLILMLNKIQSLYPFYQ